MASLNHVSIRDKEYGWVHITPEAASRLFPDTSVPANNRVFICELCGQYVTLTGKGLKIRHFRHSHGEENKDCEERVAQYDRYPAVQNERFTFPVKISLDKDIFSIFIGIPQGAFQDGALSVLVTGASTHRFDIDESQQKAGITWLPLQQDIAIKYGIEVIDNSLSNWPDYVPGINPIGSVYDGRQSKILHVEDEVTVGNDYYLITSRSVSNSFQDIDIKEIMCRHIANSVWRVYKVRATTFSPDSVRFFILYKLHLVKRPTELHIIWPMTVKEGPTAYHSADDLYIAHNGDGSVSLRLMPYSAQSSQKDMGHYFQVHTNGFQQMIAFKYYNGQRNCSNHLMVWKKPFTRTADDPDVRIFDQRGNPLQEEIYDQLPPQNQITISARYDGSLSVTANGKITLVQQIKGGERFPLEVAMGETIVITQGCDIVRRISFQKKEPKSDDFALQLLKALEHPVNDWISVPHRLGKCVDDLPHDLYIRKKISSYIRQGKMPKNIYTLILKRLCCEK